MEGLGGCRELLDIVRRLWGDVRRRSYEGRKRWGEREKVVERREREVRGREEKVAEVGQAIDERERASDQRGSELNERSKRVEELEEEMETRSAQLGGLNASTSAPGSNSWPVTLLRSVVPRVLGDRTSSFLFCSCPSSSSNTSSSLNPNSSTIAPLSSSSIPLQRRPRRDPYLSTGGQGSYLVLVGIGVCAVMLKVLVRRLTGVGMWSWLARR